MSSTTSLGWLPRRPTAPLVVDHTAILCADIDRSIEFYRDGIGLALMNDIVVDGPFDHLFEVRSNTLRAVKLGDPSNPGQGALELLCFDGYDPASPAGRPRTGLFLISFVVNVVATVRRLEEARLGSDLKAVERRGGLMATVRDPDGVLIELVEATLAPAPPEGASAG